LIVGIHQPNYLPWLGYFRKIAACDLFVFCDNAQMSGSQTYVSRNEIKTRDGRYWITIPTKNKGDFSFIHQTLVAGHTWVRKHMRTLEINYSKAGRLDVLAEVVAPVLFRGHERIAELNIALIRAIAQVLGLNSVRFVRATELPLQSTGAESIPEILQVVGATTYMSGRGGGAKRYLNVDSLQSMGIKTAFVSTVFEPYPQLYGKFEPNLSVVDALLNVGPERTRKLLTASGDSE